MKIANFLWNHTSQNDTTGTWVTHGQQLFDESMYLKWTTKLFSNFLDLTVLNRWILLSSCGAKYTYRDFRLLLVWNLIEAGNSQDCPTPRLVGWPNAAATNVVWLESPQPAKSSTQLPCRLCPSCWKRKGTVYKCTRCDMSLCVVPCFVEYHTRVTLYITLFVNTVCRDKSDPRCQRPAATRIM